MSLSIITINSNQAAGLVRTLANGTGLILATAYLEAYNSALHTYQNR